MSSIRAHLCGLLIVTAGACSPTSEDVVATARAPDGKAEAVLIETNGGATTSFGYRILLSSTIAKDNPVLVANLYGATRNESAYGANLVWTSHNSLEIRYLNAKQEKLEKTAVRIDGQMVTIHLRSGIADESAPPGGMLYNLKRR